MLARLGDVVYWLGTGLSILMMFAGVAAALTSGFGSGQMWIVTLGATAIISLVPYLAGRSFRYVLAGH